MIWFFNFISLWTVMIPGKKYYFFSRREKKLLSFKINFLLKLTCFHSFYAKSVKERITFFHAFSTLHAFLFISLQNNSSFECKCRILRKIGIKWDRPYISSYLWIDKAKRKRRLTNKVTVFLALILISVKFALEKFGISSAKFFICTHINCCFTKK